MHPQKKVPMRKAFKYAWALFLRWNGQPIAYILGYKDWMGMRLQVNTHVLIPRSETEILAQHMLNSAIDPKVILDIGTGSGALALWAKKTYSYATVHALDISKKALKVAHANAKEQQLDVIFQLSDLLEKIPKQSYFDLIMANLPYVPMQEKVSSDVHSEPPLAVYSGQDGLVHYRRLAEQIAQKEISFRSLWIEFLPSQAHKITHIFAAVGVATHFPDLSGQLFFAQIQPHDVAE